jgi:hypothetical protein
MRKEPVIRPLSIKENIYALYDESGRTMGTGTREVCEVLLYLIARINAAPGRVLPVRSQTRQNVRAVIPI